MSKSQAWKMSARLILLLLSFAQLTHAATQLSITIDEGFHITSGYEYLRTGKLHLFDEHPPLVKALFAWPLFFVHDLVPPEQSPAYTSGDLISVAQATALAYQPIDRIVVACRIPVALLTLLLAATVYRWATDYTSPDIALFILAWFIFDPNILAHGSLATTDLGATAFIFWFLLSLFHYLNHPKPAQWWITAILLGLAQAAKLTALLLFPIGGVIILVHAWKHNPNNLHKALRHAGISYMCMILIAGFVLWALYGFEIRTVPGIMNGKLPIPVASHIERGMRLRANLQYGREAFLLGQNRMHGWWYYFPLAFVLKTPLPFMITFASSLMLYGCVRKRPPHSNQPTLTLILFPLLYGLSSLSSPLNIGYRHLLPMLPFLYVLLSYTSAPFISKSESPIFHIRPLNHNIKTMWLVLLVAQAIAIMMITPYYLTYFNLIAGGPRQGWRFLADSNTDWGQTLKALSNYQHQHQLGPIKLSIFTFLDPAIYDIVYEPIAPMENAAPVLPHRFNPAPGIYAISTTTLNGVPLPYPATYDWFRHRPPLAQIAYAMHIYEVPEETPQKWLAQCTQPVVPLTPEAIKEGFDIHDLRTIMFDCEQSWIIPEGRGWYVRATPGIDHPTWPQNTDHLERWPEWLHKLPLANLEVSYVQKQPGKLPPFTIWEWSPKLPTPAHEGAHIALGETLTFLGYEAPSSYQAGTSLDVITYWRVDTPPTRPLSLMLHLINPEGKTIAVGDGLGLTIDQWHTNDIIMQRHKLEIPPVGSTERYTILSGAYWLDTMERLHTQTGDTFHIASIDIKP